LNPACTGCQQRRLVGLLITYQSGHRLLDCLMLLVLDLQTLDIRSQSFQLILFVERAWHCRRRRRSPIVNVDLVGWDATSAAIGAGEFRQARSTRLDARLVVVVANRVESSAPPILHIGHTTLQGLSGDPRRPVVTSLYPFGYEIFGTGLKEPSFAAWKCQREAVRSRIVVARFWQSTRDSVDQGHGAYCVGRGLRPVSDHPRALSYADSLSNCLHQHFPRSCRSLSPRT
jgi:hypothetical protein